MIIMIASWCQGSQTERKGRNPKTNEIILCMYHIFQVELWAGTGFLLLNKNISPGHD